MANTTKKATDNKATKATTKAPKTTAKVEAPKAEATKTAKSKAAETNTEKVNQTITIDEVVKMYEECGIKCYNPEAKGNYRIMGNKKGSSLNLQKHKYIIFSTDTDFEAVEGVKDNYKDLVCIKGGNSQDKSRPNKVEFTALDTLKALLKVYAANPANALVAAK